MGTLISIGLIGVFAYHCAINASECKGASENLKAVMTIAGSLGFIAYVVAIIWSFWYYPWWQPVVLFLVTTIVVAPITAPLFQKHVYGYVISVMAVLAFTIIGLSSLSVANVESQSSI